MSSIYSVFNEPYMRLFELARRQSITTLPDKHLNLKGRTLPAIVRQDESIKIPSLTRSNDMLAYLLACYLWLENSDYQMSVVINHFLRMARRYKYEGSWKIWWDLAEYFELEIVEGRQQLYNEQRSRSSSGPNGQSKQLSTEERATIRAHSREATIFSYMNFIEFLLEHFSEDDLFGNLFKRAKSLAKTIKLVDNQEYQKILEQRAVKRTIRHRGYRDKGTLPSSDLAARREANRQPERDKEVLFDSLNQVIDWGSSEE